MPFVQFADAQHNLGVALFNQQRHAEAEQAYRESLRLRPDFGPSLAALADVLRCQGRVEEALTTYRRALERSPDLFATHSNYGLLLAQRGELEQGLKHCRQAVALKPDSASAHHQLGKVLLEFGRIKEAMDALSEARRLGNDSADLCMSVGKGWLQLGDYHEAKLWFERALKLGPDLVEARCQLGTVHLLAGEPERASSIFKQVLEKWPESVEAHVGLARARLEQGDVEGAVASHQQAIHIRREWSVLHVALGQTLSSAGDLDGAISCNRQALKLNPHCVPALSGLLTTLRGKATDEDLHAGEQLLQASWMTDGRRAHLHFGLAQALDSREDWARAAEHMAAANAFQKKQNEKRGQAYVPANYRRFIDLLIASFTPDYFARTQGFGRDSERPVFIVGMPRSGTTLIEQVLASHPRVHGAGERRFAKLSFQLLPMLLGEKKKPIDCLAQLERCHSKRLADWHLERLHELDLGRAACVTDKMPENYQLLGWIATLFPRARIIHCLRDVRDVALSCWLTNFTQVLWANDLEHVADRIKDYLRIGDHWRRVLPVPLLEVEYEQLVANPEETSRRLLEFAGLEWDPACLDFHKTARLVSTASVAQVRQPIYKSSVGRWKHYEAALRPLLDRLCNQLGQAQKEETRGCAKVADSAGWRRSCRRWRLRRRPEHALPAGAYALVAGLGETDSGRVDEALSCHGTRPTPSDRLIAVRGRMCLATHRIRIKFAVTSLPLDKRRRDIAIRGNKGADMFTFLTRNWLSHLQARKPLPVRRNKRKSAVRPAFETLEDRCVPSATVLALSAVSGSTTGGTVVQITGTDFAGATAVNFGTSPASAFVVNSDNGQAGGALITATAPAEGAGTVDVTVTVGGKTSGTSAADQFTFENGAPTTRPIDEVGNNVNNPNLGTAGTDLLRLSPAEYGNGISTPSLTSSFTGTTTTGSSFVTVSSTTGLAVGEQIIDTNMTNIAPGTTITAISGLTLTISQKAIGTGAVSLTADFGTRVISDILNNQNDPTQGFPTDLDPTAGADIQTVDQNSLTDFGYAWGQFIDHDMDLTPTNDGEFLQILLDPNDPSGMGDQTFELSAYNPTTGTSTSNPLQQINAVTSYLDLSNVYGSTPEVADALRTFSGGQLKTSPGDMLPYNNLNYFTQTQLDALNMANSSQELPSADLFAAGDVRANENVELTALQTLFVRNHNLIASELQKENPHDFGYSTWTDEELYQEARKINIAEEQYITYTQYLPDLLGPNALPAYTGYNPNVDPAIATEFSTVAFRFGHSLLSNTIHRDNNSGQNLLPNDPVSPTINLSQDFFDPSILNPNGSFTGNTTGGSELITNVSNTTGLAVGDQIIGTNIPANTTITAFSTNSITISQNATGSGSAVALNIVDPISGQIPTDIGPILKGDADGAAQADDLLAVNEIRDLLFGNGGLQDNGQDLIARDVERARVDGIGSYNQVRVAYGLAPVTSFAQITSNVQVQEELQQAYGNVNNIDAFEGGLAEDHVPGSDMGQLFTTILANQFARLRSGDRFFYLNETWNQDELKIFQQGDTLGKIIEANTGVTNLQSDVFIFQASISGRVAVSLGSLSRPIQVGVPGITVELTDISGDILATTKTDIFGRYSFNQLSGPAASPENAPGVSATGDYQVVLVLPSFLKQASGPGTIEITRGGTNVTGADFDLSLTGPLAGLYGQDVIWMFGQDSTGHKK